MTALAPICALPELDVTRMEGTAAVDMAAVDFIALVRQGPVILRGLLSLEEAAGIRALCVDMAAREAPSNPAVTWTTPNYHRLNHNEPRSKVKSITHSWRLFYWNSLDSGLSKALRRCHDLRNRVSGLSADFGLNPDSDDFIGVSVVKQYPPGGGWMQTHVDPDIGQQVVMSISLSRWGEDFREGGLFISRPEGDLMLDAHLAPGDAVAFYPQHAHGIAPVDPDRPFDWAAMDGRWMVSSNLVTVSSLNGLETDVTRHSQAMG